MTTTTPQPRELRSFGLMMAAVIAVLFGLALPALLGRALPLWPWILSGAFAGLALVKATALRPVYAGWMKFGHIMGFINTRIILGFTFYIVLTPIGVIMKLFGADPLRSKLRTADESYRIVRSQSIEPADMERPF